VITPGSERRLLGGGAASAAFFVAAQLYQLVVTRLVLGPACGLDAELAQRVSAVDQLRQLLILASLFALPAAFGALAWARRQEAPFAALFGFVFGMVFVIAEVLYRGVELALVTRQWSVAYLAAEPAARSAIAARVGMWDELVGGWYFALLTAHLLTSLCFLAATSRPRDGWDRALALAFGLNALRLVLRISGAHAGWALGASLSRGMYFPAMFVTYGTVAAWLTREARRTPAG
jgi:hypothetical protein